LSQAAAAAPAETAKVEGPCDSKPPAAVGSLQTGPPLPILDVRPMVPVASLQAMAASAGPPLGHDEVRRLPTVEPGVGLDAALPATGSDEAPKYPSTSTP